MPRLLLVFAILFTPLLQPSTNLSPAQPAQALHGPGGREYTHQVVTKAHFGEGSHEYGLYEPVSFFGKNREYALGNTPQQRFMGFWSDGVAVKELIVTDKP
jgi:hypothetical protein